ncbi:hypothetical protein BGX30_004545 [Mortierella sp. GBA39]|nr:hypothetical protein BGX30_004545 [Mortierella sp. GBA39]
MQFIPIKHTISISIFDIPLILDLICDNLTKDDLLPCLQVSRDWFDLFQPQVFRRVEFVNLKKRQTWALLDSAARIQTLTIDLSDAGWFLNNPSSPCTNLIELHCIDYDYQPKDMYFWGLSPSIVDQTRNALLLVETNPKLRTLFVEHNEWRYKDDHFTEPVFESLATHTSLTRIHISLQSISFSFRYTLYNSLPVGLRDLEFRYLSLYSSWDESDSATTLESKLTTTLLPALERLCLSGPQERVSSHWQEEAFIPSPFSPARQPIHANYYDPEAVTLIKRAPRLRDLVLRDHYGMLQDVLQLLVTSCPDVETIDLSTVEAVAQDDEIIETTTTTTGLLSPGSRFAKLKEFRIEGEWSPSTHQAIAELVSRSTDTLEIAWLDRGSWLPITDTANPFHISTETSWTRCTQLKELVLYQEKGFSMSDYCWNAPAHSRTIPDAVEEDYSTVFSRLEKLRLSVVEPLWQECPDGYHTGIAFRAEGEWSAVELDDDWNPIIRDVPAKTPEDDIRGRDLKEATQRKEWEHRLAFILQVRELYGRIKDLKQLRALEIEWCACSSIRNMTLEVVLQLFYETEFDEDDTRGINFKRREDLTRTSKGWWGPITTADLSWLGLSWPTQAELEAESNVQQLASIALKNSEVEPNTSYARLADPFRRHVGRVWEDWMYLVGSCPHHWCDRVRNGNRVGYCTCRSRTDFLDADVDGYEALDSDHVVYSREFESFSGGMVAGRGGLWGSRKANRGRF